MILWKKQKENKGKLPKLVEMRRGSFQSQEAKDYIKRDLFTASSAASGYMVKG